MCHKEAVRDDHLNRGKGHHNRYVMMKRLAFERERSIRDFHLLYNELMNSFIHSYILYIYHFIFGILLCEIFINNFLNIWLFGIIHFIEASYI